jgi:hypothetical protein
MDDGIAFQLSQLLRQHFLRRAWEQPVEFAKPPRAALQIEENQRFPFSANNPRGQ